LEVIHMDETLLKSNLRGIYSHLKYQEKAIEKLSDCLGALLGGLAESKSDPKILEIYKTALSKLEPDQDTPRRGIALDAIETQLEALQNEDSE